MANGSQAGVLALRAALLARMPGVPVPFRLRNGDGSEAVVVGHGEPVFEVSVWNDAGRKALLSLQELPIAEAYIAGDIDFDGDVIAAMSLRDALVDRQTLHWLWSVGQPLLLGRRRCNTRWIAKHYDADNIQLLAADERYQTYTPGAYEHDDDSMEIGAERKLAAAFEALRLRPGARLLDVGCGWGGFLRYCAARGVDAEGITLSRHQLAFAEERLRAEGLDARVSYQDFFTFAPERRFDAISLMGVMEDLAVYPRVMCRLSRWLAPGGRVYLDFAASRRPFGVSSFITKHVWPGRFRLVYLPAFLRAVDRNGLEVVEMHNDRRNYRLWVRKVHDRWVERKADVLKVADEQTWRLFRLLHAGVTATMEDSTRRASAYRVVLAPRSSTSGA